MTTAPLNTITLSLEDQDKLHAYLTEKQVGAELEITCTVTLNELDEKVAVLGINTIKLPGYKPQIKEPESGGETIAAEWSRMQPMQVE